MCDGCGWKFIHKRDGGVITLLEKNKRGKVQRTHVNCEKHWQAYFIKVGLLKKEWCTDESLAEFDGEAAAKFSDAKAPGEAFSLPEIPGVHVVIETASGEKCARCWKVLPEIGAADGHEELCNRCVDVVSNLATS